MLLFAIFSIELMVACIDFDVEDRVLVICSASSGPDVYEDDEEPENEDAVLEVDLEVEVTEEHEESESEPEMPGLFFAFVSRFARGFL
jgi:hypothetical protein